MFLTWSVINVKYIFLPGWVKYSMFAFNFVFWMFGALLIGIGTYAAIENWKQGQGNSALMEKCGPEFF